MTPEEKVALYEAALTAIWLDCGKVCDEYEVCTHESCMSSYTAWATADAVLYKTGVFPKEDEPGKGEVVTN